MLGPKIFCASILFSMFLFSAFAESTISFENDGEVNKRFTLDRIIKETRYKEEVVNSTCTRQVAYEDTECDDVTYYKEECNYETVPDQECDYETTYEEVCHTTSGRNECRMVSDRVCNDVTKYKRECKTVPGGMICETINGRRVCRSAPDREECRDVPYTEQECRNATKQECDWVPGERVCQSVPHREYVCHNVNRTERVCKNVPYTKYECESVTKYRSEEYACTKVEKIPYVVEKNVSAMVTISYEGLVESAIFKGSAALNDKGEVKISIKDESQKSFLISLVTKEFSKVEKGEDLEVIASYVIKFMDKDEFLSPLTKDISNILLTKESFSFQTGKVFDKSLLKLFVAVKSIDGQSVAVSRDLKQEEFEVLESDVGSIIKVNLSSFDTTALDDSRGLVFASILMDAPKNLISGKVSTAKLSKKRRAEVDLGVVLE